MSLLHNEGRKCYQILVLVTTKPLIGGSQYASGVTLIAEKDDYSNRKIAIEYCYKLGHSTKLKEHSALNRSDYQWN
jgi:hypothetical protein